MEIATQRSDQAKFDKLAASADEASLFVVNAQARTVCRIGLPAFEMINCFPTGGAFPIAAAVDSQAGVLWLARLGSTDLAGLSLDTAEQVTHIELPSPPLGLALDARDGQLYVTLPRDNAVLRIDTASGEVSARATGIMEADDLDLLPPAVFEAGPDT